MKNNYEIINLLGHVHGADVIFLEIISNFNKIKI